MMLINNRILITVLIFLTFAQGKATAQKQTSRETTQSMVNKAPAVSSDRTYPQVLDILMPKTPLLTEDVETVLAVRVEPSFEGEFQYVFLKKKSNTVEVIKKVAAKNIFYQVTALEQATEEKLLASDVAPRIKVKETQTSISAATFDDLVKDFKLAVQKNEASRKESGLDGTQYVFWLSGVKQSTAEIWGGNLKGAAQSDENPLITWVRKMQKEIGL